MMRTNKIIQLLATCFYLLPEAITKRKRYIKACISGVISLCVQLIAFNLLRLVIMSTWANTIAVELAILCNFFINNAYTFSDKTNQDNFLIRLAKFNLVAMASMVIQYALLHFEIKYLGTHALYENITVLIGIVIGSIVNFILYKTVVWRTHN